LRKGLNLPQSTSAAPALSADLISTYRLSLAQGASADLTLQRYSGFAPNGFKGRFFYVEGGVRLARTSARLSDV
jgi:hypothetical protein